MYKKNQTTNTHIHQHQSKAYTKTTFQQIPKTFTHILTIPIDRYEFLQTLRNIHPQQRMRRPHPWRLPPQCERTVSQLRGTVNHYLCDMRTGCGSRSLSGGPNSAREPLWWLTTLSFLPGDENTQSDDNFREGKRDWEWKAVREKDAERLSYFFGYSCFYVKLVN